jgi:hypothetical protein
MQIVHSPACAATGITPPLKNSACERRVSGLEVEAITASVFFEDCKLQVCSARSRSGAAVVGIRSRGLFKVESIIVKDYYVCTQSRIPYV